MAKFIPTKITVNNHDVQQIGADFMNASLRGAEAAVKDWHENVLPQHFTMQGFRKYHYKERVLGYKTIERSKASSERYKYQKGIVTKEEPVYEEKGVMESVSKKLLGRESRVKHRLLGVPYKVMQRTGRMKRDVLGPYRLSTGKSNVKAVMNAPKYAYQYRTDYKSPDKIAELTTVIQSEADHMAEIIEARTASLVNRGSSRG